MASATARSEDLRDASPSGPIVIHRSEATRRRATSCGYRSPGLNPMEMVRRDLKIEPARILDLDVGGGERARRLHLLGERKTSYLDHWRKDFLCAKEL